MISFDFWGLYGGVCPVAFTSCGCLCNCSWLNHLYCHSPRTHAGLIEFSVNGFTEFIEFSDKKLQSKRLFKLGASWVLNIHFFLIYWIFRLIIRNQWCTKRKNSITHFAWIAPLVIIWPAIVTCLIRLCHNFSHTKVSG